MVGYDAQRQTDIRVQSDLTTTVDLQIREKTLELGEITVIAERPPVEPDKTTSKYIMSAEELESVPMCAIWVSSSNFKRAFQLTRKAMRS